MSTRHLHRDYETTFCGKDASYLPMTYDPKQTTCTVCKRGHKAHVEELKEAEKRAQELRDAAEKAHREIIERRFRDREAERERAKAERRAVRGKA